MRIRWRTHVLALVTYTLWALILTWPLVAHFTTHVPGNGADDPPLTWNLWWVRYALLELHASPFQTSYLFHPIGINLAFYTLTLLNGMLSIPLQGCAGLPSASNALLLSSFVLSGYGAFLLATYLLRPCDGQQAAGSAPIPRKIVRAAALSAGLLYAFASSKLFYAALGQWNVASSQWIPFYVLYLFRTGDSPGRLRNLLLAAIFLLLQAYAELTYASFLVLFTAFYAIWRVWTLRAPDHRRQAGRLMAGLFIIALLTLIGLVPIVVNMIPDMRAEGDVFAEGGGFADVFSADLVGFLVPTSLHPIFGSLVGHLDFPHDVGQHLYLGYSVLLLSIAGAAYWSRFGKADPKRRHEPHRPGAQAPSADGPRGPAPPLLSPEHQAKFWSVSALVWWLFTLGPTLRIDGHDTGIPMPFRVVEQLPFFEGNRYPSRYSVLLTLSLAVLVGLGVAALLDLSMRRGASHRAKALRLAAPLLVLLALFEHLALPLPLSSLKVPPVYEEIASTMPGEWTLLDIPVAWRNGSRVAGTLDTIIMFEQYYQAVHKKPVLAGNTSRNPPLKFQYFSEAPVVSTLIALETGHEVAPDVIERDRALAPEVLRFLNVRAIVVHPEKAGASMIPYLESVMPVSRFYKDAGTVGYRVALSPWPATWTIAPGEELSRLSYAEGWGIPTEGWIWAQRKKVRLLVPMNGTAQTMAFEAFAPRTGQMMTVEVNGNTTCSVDLSEGAHRYSVKIAASLLKMGLNEVVLHFQQLTDAGEVKGFSQAVGQTGIDSPASITVKSAGNEVGDFGLVYVNGKQVSPNQRGYNVVVLDPHSGAVEDAVAFDTHMDPAASQALVDYVHQIPEGRLVAVAAADEASRLLSPEAAQALGAIGAKEDLQGRFRWEHAVIGVLGADPGAAIEAIGWIRTVTVTTGTGATEPALAAAFGTITFSSSSP